jgi:16S rRNA (uracil1498-N3)-methyltransferase
MKCPRVYHPELLSEQTTVTLTPFASHHLIKVLRIKIGAPLILFSGHGGEFKASAAAYTNKCLQVHVHQHQPGCQASRLKIHLGQGLSRSEKMDYSIQKAVELGVSSLTPLFTEYCIVKLPKARQEKKLAHWRATVISACEQSGRTDVPTLHAPVTFLEWIKHAHTGARLIADPRATKTIQHHTRDLTANLLLGPEGGFSPEEYALAEQSAFKPLSLGPRVLRTETATVAALSTLQSHWGDS